MSDNNNVTIILAIACSSVATSMVSAATMYAFMSFGKAPNNNNNNKNGVSEDECVPTEESAAPSQSHSQALTTTHIPEASYNSSHPHHRGDYYEGPPDVVPVSPARSTTVLAVPGGSTGIEVHRHAFQEAKTMTEIAKEHGMKISDEKALEISWHNHRDERRRYEEHARELRGYGFHHHQNEENRQHQTKLQQETNSVLQQEAHWRERVDAKFAHSFHILSKAVLQTALVVLLFGVAPTFYGGFQSWQTDGYRGLLCGSGSSANDSNTDNDTTTETPGSWFTSAKKYMFNGMGIGAIDKVTDYVLGDYASCFSQDTLWHIIDVVFLVMLLQLLAWISGLVSVPRAVLQGCQLALLYGSVHEWMDLPWWELTKGVALFWLGGGACLQYIFWHVQQTLRCQTGIPHASQVSRCLESFNEADTVIQSLPMLMAVLYAICSYIK